MWLVRRKRVVALNLSFSSRKGQVSLGFFEIILVVVILFVVGVAWVVTNSFGGEIMQELLDDPNFLTTNESRDSVETIESRAPSFFSGAFALLFVGFLFVGFISAWYAPSNPIFLVVVFLLIIMVLIIPLFLGDAWTEISDEFDGSETGFLDWVLSNYLLVSVVFTMSVLGVMFARYKDVF